jgi:hypothetical protein
MNINHQISNITLKVKILSSFVIKLLTIPLLRLSPRIPQPASVKRVAATVRPTFCAPKINVLQQFPDTQTKKYPLSHAVYRSSCPELSYAAGRGSQQRAGARLRYYNELLFAGPVLGSSVPVLFATRHHPRFLHPQRAPFACSVELPAVLVFSLLPPRSTHRHNTPPRVDVGRREITRRCALRGRAQSLRGWMRELLEVEQ